jgi:uncharacterized hydrophobic protein (TIGR00271 family)
MTVELSVFGLAPGTTPPPRCTLPASADGARDAPHKLQRTALGWPTQGLSVARFSDSLHRRLNWPRLRCRSVQSAATTVGAVPLLRIVVTPDLTGQLVAMVAAEPSCTTVVVTPGGAVHPVAGDVVQCELGRDAVDEVVRSVADLPGSTVSLTDSTLLVGENRHHVHHGDAVMWSQVGDMLERSSRLTSLYVIVISVAGAIAAVGILENLFLLVIAAMALSPDYFPLITGCFAVVRRQGRELVSSVTTLVAGFAAAALAAWLLTEVLTATGVVGRADPAVAADGGDAVAVFVTQPNWISLVVACLAGVAGALSVTMSDNRALVGVFVSITTIPAAAGIGVAMADRDWPAMAGSAGQLAVNVASLYVTGAVTLWLQAVYWQRRAPGVARPLLPASSPTPRRPS